MSTTDFAPSAAHGAVAPASPSPDQIVLWGVNDDASCKCSLGHACPPKNRGKHPKCAPYEPGDNLGNFTGAEHGRIVIDVDVRTGDGFAELRTLPGFDAADLKRTYAVATASGGAHFYFRHPFHVGNGKLAPNIDVRGDKREGDGWAYVVAPGSRIVRDDGGVGTHEPYEGCPTELAPCPDWLLAALLTRGSTKEKGEPVRAIDETHPDWDRRVDMAIGACKTMPESKGDGEASKCLVRLAARLVIELQLPIAHACELIDTFFNPRCTNDRGEAWPWKEKDIVRALERVAQQDDPMRRVAPAEFSEMIKARTNPNRTPRIEATTTPEREKQLVGAGHEYSGERQQVTRAGLAAMLYGSGAPDWDGVLWYDVLAQRPRATNPPVEGTLTLERGELSRSDIAQIALWLDVKGFSASKEMIQDAIWAVVAKPDRQRNLITEYFDALPKVTEANVLPTLAVDVFGCTDPFENTLLMKTLVAAARRARTPGTFHKAMLVLKGPQECGKTPAVKILAGDWYHTTGNGDLADRDTILECQGKLLVEVEELSAMRKADANALKSAISRTHDAITKKYEPDARTYPRSFAFIGTTNQDDFLTDDTGNARYWVLNVGTIDLPRLEELRDTIWAEADFLARSGYSNELEATDRRKLNEGNDAYVEGHPWLEKVRRYISGRSKVTSTEVLEHVLPAGVVPSRQHQKDAAECLRLAKCKLTYPKVDGRTVRTWLVPEDVAAKSKATQATLRIVSTK